MFIIELQQAACVSVVSDPETMLKVQFGYLCEHHVLWDNLCWGCVLQTSSIIKAQLSSELEEDERQEKNKKFVNFTVEPPDREKQISVLSDSSFLSCRVAHF